MLVSPVLDRLSGVIRDPRVVSSELVSGDRRATSLPTGECRGLPAASKRPKLACQVISVTLFLDSIVAVVELERLLCVLPSKTKDASGTLIVVAGSTATGGIVSDIRGH